MSTYKYDDKLDSSRRQIRICTIHPGDFEDPISCDLRTVSMNDDPEYETLSYTWGAPIFDHTLFVDGTVLKITRSLHNAIRYLRRQKRHVSKDEFKSSRNNTLESDVTKSYWDPEASGVLWADAICINQDDVDERSSQVGLMGEIYRRGSRLHVWIGTVGEIRHGLLQRHPREPQPDYELANPKRLAELKIYVVSEGTPPVEPTPLASATDENVDADVKGAMEILQVFAEDKHVQHLPFFKFTAVDMNLEKDEFWYKSIAMLVGILTQPWWKRVWVVQEVVLSRSTEPSLLHVGQHKMSLSTSDNLRNYFVKHFLGCCHEWLAIVVGRYGLLYRLYDAVSSVDILRRVAELYSDRVLDMTVAYAIFPLREATDPHDYIYGSRALMKDSPSGVDVDYRMPISQLYVAATRAICREHDSLEYLEVAVGVGSENRHHLPSWCIDWGEHNNGLVFPYLGQKKFDAAGGRPYQLLDFRGFDDALFLEAAAIGTITFVNTVIEETVVDPVGAVIEWIEAIGHNQVLDDGDISIIIKVLMRDLYVDWNCDFQRVSPQYMHILKEWRRFVSSSNRVPNETSAEALFGPIGARMRRRQRLFITTTERLGAGPPATREGDCLFIAEGSEVPLLLRPLHDSAIENGQQDSLSYQFVGRCYVHGIMDGGAMNEDTEWQTIGLL
ncbi:MAG: hypothetical protein Q9172_002304 [Xanthocarpia lactea]